MLPSAQDRKADVAIFPGMLCGSLPEKSDHIFKCHIIIVLWMPRRERKDRCRRKIRTTPSRRDELHEFLGMRMTLNVY